MENSGNSKGYRLSKLLFNVENHLLSLTDSDLSFEQWSLCDLYFFTEYLSLDCEVRS